MVVVPSAQPMRSLVLLTALLWALPGTVAAQPDERTATTTDAATPAAEHSPTNATSATREALAGINDAINAARQLLPATVGGDLTAEGKAVAALNDALAAAKQALKPEYESDAQAFQAVLENLADAEVWATHVSLSHDCNRARHAVRTAHLRNQPAGEAAMRQLQSAIDAFAAGAAPGGDADASFFRQQVDGLQSREAELVAAAQGATAAAATAELSTLRREARDALAALMQLNAGVKPVPAAAVDRLAAATEALKIAAPGEERLYADELPHHRVEQHWSLEDPASFEAIAASLGGEITVRGVNRGKRLTLKLRAKADRCYTLVMRFGEWSGAEAVDEMSWETPGQELQEFAIARPDGWKGLPLHGFCATGAGAVTAKARLAFEGRRNALRYVIVDHERKSFPSALAARLQLVDVDHCDADAWKALWLQPVPGTRAFVEDEPVLIGRVDAEFVTYWTAGAPRAKRALAARFTTSPKTTVAVRSKLQPASCPDGQASGRIRSELSEKIRKCHVRIDKKYAPKWKRVEKLRGAGDTAKAEELAQKLEAKVAADQEQRCAPLEKRAADAFATAFAELQAALPGSTSTDGTDRVGALRAVTATTPGS